MGVPTLRSLPASAVVFALLLYPGAARAETPEQAADRLFNEAKALATAGRFAEACPKLEESQRLDPGIGTEFDLADCYERTGRPAHAYRLFQDVANIARASGKVERANAAAARTAALENKVPRLRIVSSAPAPGLVVTLDGEVQAGAALGTAVPVEAGDHKVEASAPGRNPWNRIVHVDPSARLDVEVPPLGEATTARRPEPAPGLGTQRVAAIGVGAAGLVGVLAGGVAGVMSLAWHNSAQSDCPDARCPAGHAGFDTWHQAVIAGDVSTVAFVAGGALIAGAAVLWLTAPKASGATVGLVVRGTGVGLQGVW